MKIVADDKIPFLKGVLEPVADMVYVPGKDIRNELIKDADALLIRTRTKCTPELLKGTAVKFISTATIGFDHIDTQYCEQNNIKWTNAPGCNSSSVQQYVTAALLKLSHDHNLLLKGKIMGVVGVGNVGSKVAKAAQTLGMEVMLNDPPRARKEGKSNFVLLGDILYNADIISVHVPLNVVGEDETWHMFNDKSFKKMRKGTWFINAARGEVTDTAALKRALAKDKVHAILDVWENEPDIDTSLMHLSFLATPHIAGYSTDGKANGTSMAVNSLCSYFGIPINNWYPKDVPPPLNPVLQLDGKGKNDFEILREAVDRTYSIEHDDIRLRLSPKYFEKQRGDYRLRREFTAYTVKLKNANREVKIMLQELGFKVS
jgi:erythronate-4-phosphate dehydrogenase